MKRRLAQIPHTAVWGSFKSSLFRIYLQLETWTILTRPCGDLGVPNQLSHVGLAFKQQLMKHRTLGGSES